MSTSTTITARQSGKARMFPAFARRVMIGLFLVPMISTLWASPLIEQFEPGELPTRIQDLTAQNNSVAGSAVPGALPRQLRPEVSPEATRPLRELTAAIRSGNLELSIFIADRLMAIDPKMIVSISESGSTFQAVWRLRRQWYNMLLVHQQQNLLKDFKSSAEQAYRELPSDETRAERLLEFCLQFDLSPAGVKAWEELAATARDRGQAELAASIYFDLAQHPLLKSEDSRRQAFFTLASRVLNERMSFVSRPGQRKRRAGALQLLKQRVVSDFQTIFDRSDRTVEHRTDIEHSTGESGQTMRGNASTSIRFPSAWEERADTARQFLRSRGVATVSLLQPTVTDELIVTRDPLRFAAHDRQTGKTLWTLPSALIRADAWDSGTLSLPDWQSIVALECFQTISSQMTLDDDRLYLVDRTPSRADGRPAHRLFVAVETTTGKILWRLGSQSSSPTYPFSDTMFLGPPLLMDDHLLFLTEKDQNLWLYVVDREHGRLEWSLPLGQLTQSAGAHPVLQRCAVAMVWDGTNCMVTTGVGEVISIHVASRSIDWRAALPIHAPTGSFQRADLPPGHLPDEWWRSWREARLFLSQKVLVGTSPESNQLSAWSLDGKPLWSKIVTDGVLLAGVTDALAWEDQCVIVVTSNGLRAYRLQNGDVVWDQSSWFAKDLSEDASWLSGRPVLLPGTDKDQWLLAPLTNGRRLLLSALTGELRALLPAHRQKESATSLSVRDQQLWSMSPRGLTWESLPAFTSPKNENISEQWSRAVATGDFQAGWEILRQIPEQELLAQLGPDAPQQAMELLQQQLRFGNFVTHREQLRMVAGRFEAVLAMAPQPNDLGRIELAGFWLACDLPEKAMTTLQSISLQQLLKTDVREFRGAEQVSFDKPRQPGAGREIVHPLLGSGPVHGIVDVSGRRGFVHDRELFRFLSPDQSVRPSRRALAFALRAYLRTSSNRESTNSTLQQNDWQDLTYKLKGWCQCDQLDAADFWVGTNLGAFLKTRFENRSGGKVPAGVDDLQTELALLATIDRLQTTSSTSAMKAQDELSDVWNHLAEGWKKRGLLQDAAAAEMLKRRSLARVAAKNSPRRQDLFQVKSEPVSRTTRTPHEGFVLPSIRERNEDVYQFSIPVTSWPGLLGDRLDVSLARPGTAIRFAGENVNSPWIYGLKQQEEDEIPLLRQAWTLHQGTAVGRLLILQVGAELMAIQPLNDEGEPQPRKLWSYEFAGGRSHPLDQMFPTARSRRHLADATSFGVVDPYGNMIGQATLVTPEMTAWIRGAVLEVIDTASGVPRWSRVEIPAASLLAGDSDTLVLIDVAGESIDLFDALDGTLLERRKMPGRFPAQASHHRRRLSSPSVVGEIPRGWWVEGRYLLEERIDAAEVPALEPATGSVLPAVRYQLTCHDLVTGKDVWVQRAPQICYAAPLDSWTMGLIRRTAIAGEGELLLLDQPTGEVLAPAIAVPLPEKVSRIVATFDKERFYVGVSNGAQTRLESPSLQLRNGYRQPYLAGEMTAIHRQSGRVEWRLGVDQEPWPLDVSRAYPVIVRCWTTPETPGSRGAVGHQRIHWATTGEIAAADDALFLNGYVTIEAGEGNELILRREFYSTRILPPNKN